ncbi:TPA_exp: putative MFS drug transporter [Trichophyton benhamiae CBS 112371]|uniref:MFS drug transporter, putative n=1 Tax=Arthroderma benhamiae (strain ATCC MYA-4681 / CBS 112371) TaxID=663331 RepID=D4ALV7_ARTBC|nr:MFS drug transporter, putative [Trichophyton benhamiae CBS 112371]EFE36366.1 MFS drug transporter, putative [Trichophyton benhamiae CBS 112371]DAA79163.1 TPA_exp: putative MFS drug transporter [Trichophyton benhamiae CBS 112371]
MATGSQNQHVTHPPPSETSPLLGDRANAENGVPSGESEANDTGLPLVEEASFGELLTILMSTWVGVFFAALDGTIVATISAQISSSFNSLSLISWLATAYLVSSSACQPISGKLTDIFSRRTGLVISNILFGVGNLICGLATEEWVMILGRTIAGMGGGGLTAISTFLTSDLVPLRKRGIWQGIGNICFGIGSGLGGIFGGYVNDNWGWRWAFLIQVPFVAVSAILVSIYVNVPVRVTDTSRWKRIDFLGAGTLVCALVLFLLGLNSGGNQVPWTHPLVLTTIPLSVVLLVAFIYIEDRVAAEPIIPIRLLMDRTVLSCCLTNWFVTMAVFALFIYIPVFLQVQGYTTTLAGTRLVAQAFGTSVGSLGSGYLMRMTGRYLYFNYGSVVLIVIGIGLICTVNLATPAVPPFVYLFISGLGYGGMLTSTLVAIIAAVDHEHQAVVTSASYAFRSTGSSIGISVASAVFQNLLRSGLWSRLGHLGDAEKIIRKITERFGEIRNLPPDIAAIVRDCYMGSLRAAFLTALGLAAMGALASLAMREHKLHMNLARKD